jgi:uncharacterized delta-60 repeat protein
LTPDGKIVVGALQAVNGTVEITVLRYASAGWLDDSFGNLGMVTYTAGTTPYPLDFATFLDAAPVALQPDGSVLAMTILGQYSGSVTVVIRVSPSGSIDPSFGTGGKVTINQMAGTGLAVQPNGKIVIVSREGAPAVRLNSDGSTDSTFGTSGYAYTPYGFPCGTGALGNVVVQRDGRILAVGGSRFGCSGFSVVRWLPNGQVDTSYGTSGLADVKVQPPGVSSEQDSGVEATSMVQEADGSVVVAGTVEYVPDNGSSSEGVAVAHVLTNGQADPAFGSSGASFLKVAPFSADIGLALDPSGFVYLGGRLGSIQSSDFLVAKMRLAAAPIGSGYRLVGSDGGIFSFGNAAFLGSMGGIRLNQPIIGMAANPSGQGYWMVSPDGGVFSFGDAKFYGSTGNLPLNKPIVGMAPTPTGHGYWMVAADGGIFSFGDARFAGSMGGLRLNRPIVGMATSPTGHGYWLVAADGGIFPFGDANFLGSTGSIHLNQPIVNMAATPTGLGYWLVAADGGIFSFGDAAFFGSTGNLRLNKPIVGMASTPSGNGYWLVAADGGIFAFGDAPYLGSTGNIRLTQPIVAMAGETAP